MIPSTNGNSAPKGCNPVSSNCVVWQGPNLPCIDLCTGDNISAILAKICEQLVAVTSGTGITIDISLLSPGCLQDAYPDSPFESIEDYINALVAYVCAMDGDFIGASTSNVPIVAVPRGFYSSNQSTIKIKDSGSIVTSITNVTDAQQHGVTQEWVPPSYNAAEAYNAYLNGTSPDPGFALNKVLEPADYMLLNSTNPSLYIVEAASTTDLYPFNGPYSSWGELIGKMICELSHCALACLNDDPISTSTSTITSTNTNSTNKPFSKANKQVIERMIKSEVQKSTRSVPKVISKYVLTSKLGKAVDMHVLLQALERDFGLLRNMSGNVADMRDAILKEPMNLNNEDALNGNTKMGLMPGWYKTPNSLSQSVANAWMTIADIRNAVLDIQKNFLGTTTCQDIVYDVKGTLGITGVGVVNGIMLDFTGTKVNSPFVDCGGQSKITVEDTDFNSITKYVNVIAESKAVGGTSVSFQDSNINLVSNYKVTVDMCFSDGDSQCAKSIQFNVENNQSCPTITFPASSATTITYKLERVNGDAYDLTLVCESQAGNEYGRRVYNAPTSPITGNFTGLPAGKTFNVYAELKSKGSGVTTKCPTVSTSTTVPACVTSNILSGSYGSDYSTLIGDPLRVACYNDTTSTYSTLAGFDSDGNFTVVKCTNDPAASCTAGENIMSTGTFISDTSSTNLIIKSNIYPSTVGPDKSDSGWKFVNTIVTPTNNIMYVYTLVNKDTNNIDQVVASCDCALNFKNNKVMNYCGDSSSVSCKVDVVGFNNTHGTNVVEITSHPYKGSATYDLSLSTAESLYFTYVNSNSDWVNDSFKFKVTNSCGTSQEMIVPITRAKRQSVVNEDVYVYVNTTSMDYSDAVDLKATFEAMKTKMQIACANWTGTIYYIPVDSTSDAGDYLNYSKSLVDMKAAASGSITVAGGSWGGWKSTPAYWSAGSKESVPTSATIISFTNATSTNANYGHTNLSDGWIGQPTASYQTEYEELQDLLTGSEVTAWGQANDTALKYFGTSGVRFKQILVPIMDSKTGESAAAALQMFGSVSGEKLKLAETNGIKVGNVKYPVDLTNYLLETSALAQAPYNMLTSNNVTMTGLKNSGFSLATWIDKGDDLSINDTALQTNLMAIMGLDSSLVGTNCSSTAQCSYQMLSGTTVLWGYHASVIGTACSTAGTASNCIEVYQPATSIAFSAGLAYKSAAGACQALASDELETGFYAAYDGASGAARYDRYVKTTGWAGSPGTGTGTCP